VDLPGTIEGIATVFESMPAEVAGYPRVDEGLGEHAVAYAGDGPNVFTQSGEHRVMDGEELSPARFLTLMADSGDFDVSGSVLEDDVVWLHASARVPGESRGQTEYFLVWAEAEGEYLFFFNARSEDDLDAVVEAFVEAAKG
jgi:hypothetical protein